MTHLRPLLLLLSKTRLFSSRHYPFPPMQRKIPEMKIYKLSSTDWIKNRCYVLLSFEITCLYARYTNKGNLGIVNLLSENRTDPFLFFVYRIVLRIFCIRMFICYVAYILHISIYRIRINIRRLIITIAVRAHDIAIVLPRECRAEWYESVNFKKSFRFVIIVTLSSFYLFVILACVNNRAPIRRFELDNREIERMTRKHGEKSVWRVRRNSYYTLRF